jgi:tetratricopeptide (TPR) repeat protein
VEINPENAEAYNYLGLVYRNQGKFGLAEQAYNKALQAAPDFSAARLNLGILNDLYLHDYQAALKNYQEYLRLNPTDEKRVSIWIAELTQRIPATADTGKEVQ